MDSTSQKLKIIGSLTQPAMRKDRTSQKENTFGLDWMDKREIRFRGTWKYFSLISLKQLFIIYCFKFIPIPK